MTKKACRGIPRAPISLARPMFEPSSLGPPNIHFFCPKEMLGPRPCDASERQGASSLFWLEEHCPFSGASRTH